MDYVTAYGLNVIGAVVLLIVGRIGASWGRSIARKGMERAEIDRTLAVYQLLRAMGLLSVEHLGLGIATYDPAAYYNAVENAPTHLVSPQGEKLDRVLRSLNRN